MAHPCHMTTLTLTRSVTFVLTLWTALCWQSVETQQSPPPYSIVMGTTINVTVKPEVNVSTTETSHKYDEEKYSKEVVVLVFLAGMVAGALLTALLCKCIDYRKHKLPAKDYSDCIDKGSIVLVVPEDLPYHDPISGKSVNGIDENHPVKEGSGGQGSPSKSHKKLQRLAGSTVKNSESSLPLLDDGDYVEPNLPLVIAKPTTSPKPQILPKPSGPNKKPLAAPRQQTALPPPPLDPRDLYSNTDQRSQIEQPYDTLNVIPEEVEYENTRFSDYATPSC